jgi:hypothetical protein
MNFDNKCPLKQIYGEIFGKGKLIRRERAKGGKKKRVKQKKTKLLKK